jgi:hypothetical protein
MLPRIRERPLSLKAVSRSCRRRRLFNEGGASHFPPWIGRVTPCPELRLITRYVLEDELRSIVERTLGRRTVAFMSGIDVRQDVSVELLTLEPRPAGASADGRREGEGHREGFQG